MVVVPPHKLEPTATDSCKDGFVFKLLSTTVIVTRSFISGDALLTARAPVTPATPYANMPVTVPETPPLVNSSRYDTLSTSPLRGPANWKVSKVTVTDPPSPPDMPS